jgi:hypothetical protein
MAAPLVGNVNGERRRVAVASLWLAISGGERRKQDYLEVVVAGIIRSRARFRRVSDRARRSFPLSQRTSNAA